MIIEDEDYQKLIDKLNVDVRIKCDGTIDGDPIDDITAYLQTLP